MTSTVAGGLFETVLVSVYVSVNRLYVMVPWPTTVSTAVPPLDDSALMVSFFVLLVHVACVTVTASRIVATLESLSVRPPESVTVSVTGYVPASA